MKTIKLELTKIELDDLYRLVLRNKEEGSYWGNKEQFIKRQNKIVDKMLIAEKVFDKG